MIETRQLHKKFGKKVAVDDISFAAPDGAVTAILGPNGAGKTTSLRMVYGLIRPDCGAALVDGHDAAREPRRVREQLGVLPDSPGLYGRLTAREHLRYAGELQGLGGARLDAAVDRLIELLDMEEIAGRRSAGFSQGERRKTALGRALVHDPQNVVLDEPTNGLDVMSSRAMRRLVRRLAEDGKCVVLSSHVMPEVAAVADRVVVIAGGRVAADATPSEILASTGKDDLEDAFVRLIGSEEGLN
jgi:sodium transport system ATP-binding protein